MAINELVGIPLDAIDRHVGIVGQRRLADAQVADVERAIAPDQQHVQETVRTVRRHERIGAERRGKVVRAEHDGDRAVRRRCIGAAGKHVLRFRRGRTARAVGRCQRIDQCITEQGDGTLSNRPGDAGRNAGAKPPAGRRGARCGATLPGAGNGTTGPPGDDHDQRGGDQALVLRLAREHAEFDAVAIVQAAGWPVDLIDANAVDEGNAMAREAVRHAGAVGVDSFGQRRTGDGRAVNALHFQRMRTAGDGDAVGLRRVAVKAFNAMRPAGGCVFFGNDIGVSTGVDEVARRDDDPDVNRLAGQAHQDNVADFRHADTLPVFPVRGHVFGKLGIRTTAAIDTVMTWQLDVKLVLIDQAHEPPAIGARFRAPAVDVGDADVAVGIEGAHQKSPGKVLGVIV